MPQPPDDPTGLDRRRFLAALSALGLGTAALPEALAGAQTPAAPPAAAPAPPPPTAPAASGLPEITRETIAAAERLFGLSFTDAERDLMRNGLVEARDDYVRIREVSLANSVPPALLFDPRPAGFAMPGESGTPAGKPAAFRWSAPAGPGAGAAAGGQDQAPADLAEAAFWPLSRLAPLVQAGKVRSADLTRMYLDRLRRFDPALHAVVTLTEERALEQAERADREIAAGRYRGPLHGIPWGAKDLLAARGYPTTWGSVPFKEQVIDEDATVVERLEKAGAVLVAKLSLGELAWGDVWFGGMTRNPWKLEQGSSGSSAGSAAAVAAGLVGFAMGSETLGSIVSPCTRTGATGLRPTFGRVSRHGAMTLCPSMDKLGPIARSVEDCAAVFDAIHGPDGKDAAVVAAPFRWDPDRDPRRLKVGYVKPAFDEKPAQGREDERARDRDVLDTLRGLGFDLVPVTLPRLPVTALSLILTAESAASFDELTLAGKDDLLVRQIEQAWPNTWRQGQMVPAVSYLQANRIRTLLLADMARLMSTVDVYVCPAYGGDNLLLTNLTGHPAVVLPSGFRHDGTPVSITFMGKLYGEADLLAVAKAYQDATGFHLRHPVLAVPAPSMPATGT